jgi:transposase
MHKQKAQCCGLTLQAAWRKVNISARADLGVIMVESNRTDHTTTSAPGNAPAGPAVRKVSNAEQPLSRADIAAHCVAASAVSERRRWQVIGMLADQVPLAEIMATTGYRPRTIREIAQRYHALGASTLEDRRVHSRGAPPLLSALLQHELQQMLQHPAPDGGEWTGPKVAQWIAAKTGRNVYRQRGWEYLRRLGSADEHNQGCVPDRTSRM